MRSLAELQTAFAEYLGSPPGAEPSQSLVGDFRIQGPAANVRLAVYRNNVYSSLIGALAATYPAVVRLVGDEFFRFAAREFVASHFPTAKTLGGYGDGFADFLRAFAPAASVPYIADVARLEHLYLEAYHAPEAEPISIAQFDSLSSSGDGFAIALHPSSRFLESPHPVSRIWELNVRDAPIESRVRVDAAAEHLLIIRPLATVEVRRISPAAFAMLSALAGGASYPDALDAGTKREPDANLNIQLRALAAGGTFVIKEEYQHG